MFACSVLSRAGNLFPLERLASQQKPHRICKKNWIVEDPVAAVSDLINDLRSEGWVSTKAQSDVGKIGWVPRDAVHHAHVTVYGEAQTPSEVVTRQGHDRRAHGESLIGSIAAAKGKTVEADI